MDNYPSNSRTAKAPEEETEPKKINSVVTGEVTRRKKPLGKRFTETFVGGDISTVANYVVLEVLIPAAKDMMSDAVSQGIDRMLFGESRGSSRSRSSRPSGTNGYVSYNRMGAKPPSREGLNEFARRPERRSSHDFDEIILATRAEAEEVIDRLFDLVNQYQQATVADLLELVGVSSNHVDHKWGWTDIRGAGVTKIRNGYLLDLPKPESIQ
jgi:hypothetical protein